MAKTFLQRYFPGLSRNTFLLALASLFTDISTEMLYPVLPIFLTQTLHASGSIVGLVDGFAQAAQNIVQGVSGAVSDWLQKRKPIALAGYFLAAVAKPLIGLSTTWQGVFAARFLDRLGTGIRSAPRDALIASSVDEKDRGRAFGLEGIGDNAGAFLGPLLAVYLLYALHVEIRTIFYIAIIPGLLAFFMVLLVKEQRRRWWQQRRRSTSGHGSFRTPSGIPPSDYIKGSSVRSARHWRRISCRSICAPAASAGTARLSACCSWWQASLRARYGIGLATLRFSTTAPPSR